MAWLLVDEEFNELDSYKEYLKIDGKFDINPKAAERNGLTAEVCDKGVDRVGALIKFNSVACGNKLIAFNLWFDSQMIDLETKLYCELNSIYNWKLDGFCPMLHMTDICRLPHPRGWKGKYKWPKLQEAYRFCFGEDFEGAHDALADVRATARVLQWIIKQGHKI